MMYSLAAQAAALPSPKDSIVDFLETLFPHDAESAKRLLDKVQKFRPGSETGVKCEVIFPRKIMFVCRGPNGDRSHAEYSDNSVGEDGYAVSSSKDKRNVRHLIKIKDYGDYGAPILACLGTEHSVVLYDVAKKVKGDQAVMYYNRRKNLHTRFALAKYGKGAYQLKAAAATLLHDNIGETIM
eukprot:Lankesteria_metandrocarpae@DN5438_c0_g4_i1.p1